MLFSYFHAFKAPYRGVFLRFCLERLSRRRNGGGMNKIIFSGSIQSVCKIQNHRLDSYLVRACHIQLNVVVAATKIKCVILIVC